MSHHDALIRLWRVLDRDLLYNADSLPAGARIFDRGAMRLGSPLEDGTPAPVLIDHDKDRPIGFVRHLSTFPDASGSTWLFAHATIDDAPSWLKRGTSASVGTNIVQRCRFGHAERVLRGYVPEVSLLSPGVEPAEPRAKVVLYREYGTDERIPQPGEVVLEHGQTIRRQFTPPTITVR